jgi:nitrate/nitrite-specific signal transduction histidine kinase
MLLTRRAALGATAATLVFGPARAQPAETIRIGVLTDLSGPYRDVTGPTSVACTRQAVEEFAAQNPGIRVEVIAADPLPILPSEVEVAAYRICLEALANAVRHGRATRVDVYLTCEDGHLDVRIEDDGIGLPDQIGTHGLGLASMAARASDVRGSCTVGRRPSGGTVVNARLPLTSTAVDQGRPLESP